MTSFKIDMRRRALSCINALAILCAVLLSPTITAAVCLPEHFRSPENSWNQRSLRLEGDAVSGRDLYNYQLYVGNFLLGLDECLRRGEDRELALRFLDEMAADLIRPFTASNFVYAREAGYRTWVGDGYIPAYLLERTQFVYLVAHAMRIAAEHLPRNVTEYIHISDLLGRSDASNSDAPRYVFDHIRHWTLIGEDESWDNINLCPAAARRQSHRQFLKKTIKFRQLSFEQRNGIAEPTPNLIGEPFCYHTRDTQMWAMSAFLEFAAAARLEQWDWVPWRVKRQWHKKRNGYAQLIYKFSEQNFGVGEVRDWQGGIRPAALIDAGLAHWHHEWAFSALTEPPGSNLLGGDVVPRPGIAGCWPNDRRDDEENCKRIVGNNPLFLATATLRASTGRNNRRLLLTASADRGLSLLKFDPIFTAPRDKARKNADRDIPGRFLIREVKLAKLGLPSPADAVFFFDSGRRLLVGCEECNQGKYGWRMLSLDAAAAKTTDWQAVKELPRFASRRMFVATRNDDKALDVWGETQPNRWEQWLVFPSSATAVSVGWFAWPEVLEAEQLFALANSGDQRKIVAVKFIDELRVYDLAATQEVIASAKFTPPFLAFQGRPADQQGWDFLIHCEVCWRGQPGWQLWRFAEKKWDLRWSSSGPSPTVVVAADLDGDGQDDLIDPQQGWRVYFSGRNGLTQQPAPMRRDAGAGYDLSHARRYVNFYETLHRYRKRYKSGFPNKAHMEMLANRYAYSIFNGEFEISKEGNSGPLFANYFNGQNGWAISTKDNDPGFGYPPWGLATAGLIGGYGFWARYNPDICRINELLQKMLLAPIGSELGRFRLNNYSTSSGIVYAGFERLGKPLENTPLPWHIALQFYPVLVQECGEGE